jgi:hypothetical protein
VLAALGFMTFGVDRRLEAALAARRRVVRCGARLHVWVGDLEDCLLPGAAFALIVVTRFLQRNLFPTLIEALAPGGVLLYETFTERQRTLGFGPTSPEHLLRDGELRSLVAPLDVLFYEELIAAEAVAHVVARRHSAGPAPAARSGSSGPSAP